MKGNSIKCSYLQERGWEGTDKVSSSVVWNRCCCWYCYSCRQTNTQSCQLRFLLLALLLLLCFGHHPISSTSSSIASSPTTDEAQPITELQIGELQWIGFPQSAAGGVADRPRRRERSVRRRCCVRSVCTSAMAEKEEDEEAPVFYTSFSFFSKSHRFRWLAGKKIPIYLSFLLFFPSSHPSQARRPPQKSRS